MDKLPLAQVVEKQEWMDAPAEAIQKPLHKFFRLKPGKVGRKMQNALHGSSWFDHPAHPVFTDLPIGAWTVAIALDGIEAATGRKDLAPGADAAIAIGLVGAGAAAVTGLTDWHVFKEPRPRRVGFAHLLFNSASTLLFGASLVARRRGNREVGKLLSGLGYVSLFFGARLGGSLIYEQGVGTDHAQRKAISEDFRAVLPLSELAENTPKRVEVNGVRVLLVRQGDTVYAIGERCSHFGGPLAEGELEIEEGCIECPWHDSKFRLSDGKVMGGPATMPQPAFDARVRDGQIELRMPTPEAQKEPESVAERVKVL